ncbi:MAG: ribosome biogenesis GTPase Der [Thermodesulfobacteriota bacterium]
MSFLVAIVGRPNTGKSTLFNRLTRTRKAIVDSTSGVTRDRNYGDVTWEGKRFVLVDTGGFEPAGADKLVTRMQEQTTLAMEEADAIIFLMDGREGLTATDYEAIDRLRKIKKPVFYVANKIDGLEKEDLLLDFYQLGVDHIYGVSAEHGYGIRDFMDELAARIPAEEAIEAGPEVIRIAILGRPNVGKSSLVNRLLGEERMLVTEIAGTTRDSVDTILEKGGTKYRLIDTAGIRKKGRISHRLEKYSILKALKSLAECDVAIVLIDAGEGITDQDTHILGYVSDNHKGCVIAVNKWDLVKDDEKRKKKLMEDIAVAAPFMAYAPVLKISALSGYRVKGILKSVDEVYEQYTARISTGKVNQALKEILAHHEPPFRNGRRVKLYYMTQTGIKPPTFVVFSNYPESIHFSYERYLINQLREKFAFDRCPLRLILRRREKSERPGGTKKT